MRIRWTAALAALVLAGVAACGGSDDGDDTASSPDSTEAAADPADSAIDLTRLPVGDDFVTATDPAVGYLCTTMPTDGQGAPTMGPWFNGDGTWNAETKYVVEGAVDWPHELTVDVQGDTRVITSNGLPDHTTGEFPVDPSSDAGSIDPNPSEITAQSYTLEVPANPTLAAEPSCVGGEVGMLLTGVVLNNAIDAAGRDAVAWEVQDSCQGHPHGGGVYHYHSLTYCVDETATGEHSALFGYALDGFGIYGLYGEDGEVLTNADLDECHGHTHEIEWDAETVEMYHYHATYEFPYTVGCFRGSDVNTQAFMPAGGPPAGR